MAAKGELSFPKELADKLEPHLPPARLPGHASSTPFVTLTFATSLDSALSLAPGTRTTLSGPESKAMTHYLRSRHDAICIGVSTAVADDPGLNCRIAGVPAESQPRPVVVDPHLRWEFTRDSKVMALAREGRGLAPYIVTNSARTPPPEAQRTLLEELGGRYIVLDVDPQQSGRFRWEDILRATREAGLQSIMIEGGAEVINALLDARSAHLVDSVIVTIAPTWLGQGSVQVSPPRRTGAGGRPVSAARLTDTLWMPLGEDVVLCGKIIKSS